MELIISENSTISLQSSHYRLDRNNLLSKVYRYFEKRFAILPVRMTLTKNIPIGAGLGGGSSNAASLIVGLDQLFDLQLSTYEKRKIALLFGSDVPYFIDGGFAWVEGRGEIINTFDFSLDNEVLLFYPNTFISSADAYAKYVTFKQKKLEESKETLIAHLKKKKNDMPIFCNTIATMLLQKNYLHPIPLSSQSTIFSECIAPTLSSAVRDQLFFLFLKGLSINQFTIL